MDYTGNSNNEPKVLENKKILFMLNTVNEQTFNDKKVDNYIGLIGPNAIGQEGFIINLICHDDVSDFVRNLNVLNLYEASTYEKLPILVQTTDISAMGFTLTERLGFKIFLGRWFFDKNNGLKLKVLEIKPHMTEIDKDLRFEHNIHKLCIGGAFEESLSGVDDRYFLELLDFERNDLRKVDIRRLGFLYSILTRKHFEVIGDNDDWKYLL